jgi:hypothetical protein
VKTMGGSAYFLDFGLEAQRPKKVGSSAFAACGAQLLRTPAGMGDRPTLLPAGGNGHLRI